MLSVTSLVRDASPLMGPTLLKLAREVEEQLYSDSTLHERELLHHFLAERRRGRNAIVAVSEDVVIANKAGARLQVDHRALWHQVESGLRDSTEIELEPAGDTGAVRLRTIEHAGSVVGLVIVAERPSPRGRRQSGRRPPRSMPPASGRPSGRSFPRSCGPRPQAATGCW